MCHSNDALIRKSHQQMSQRLSTLEECQREVRASMGFETPEPVVYAPLPPSVVEDLWAWYRKMMMMRLNKNLSEVTTLPSLFLVLDAKGGQ
jgi:hypothetical protein